MKQVVLLSAAFLFISCSAAPAQEQSQFDIGFGVGTLFSPSYGTTSNNHSAQNIGGGTYLNFNGDYIWWHHVGIEGDVAWRASQGSYGGYQPFRPIFWDFNGEYAPMLGRHAQLVLLGGIGGLSTRFYTQQYTCNYYYYSCTNYYSTTHFMGDVGAGVRLWVHGGLFVMPEFRSYFIHNNVEFNSGYATRVGATVGYTFGR